jgi:hypothetical protein
MGDAILAPPHQPEIDELERARQPQDPAVDTRVVVQS